jgi:hypothetical protein
MSGALRRIAAKGRRATCRAPAGVRNFNAFEWMCPELQPPLYRPSSYPYLERVDRRRVIQRTHRRSAAGFENVFTVRAGPPA